MKFIPLLSLGLIGLASLASATTTPSRIVLPDAALSRIVGGAAADITISYPPSHVKTGITAGTTAWNPEGNICQYDCSSGGNNGNATDVGFDVGGFIVQPEGFAPPTFSVYGDGAQRATTSNPNFLPIDGYDVYSVSLRTQCSGGDRNGQLCRNDRECRMDCANICTTAPFQSCTSDANCSTGGKCVETGSGCTSLANAGNCVACDQNGVCNTAGVANAPCVAGSVGLGSQTCYLVNNCSESPTVNNTTCPAGQPRTDCTESGAPETPPGNNFKTGVLNAGGPLHAIRTRAVANGNFILVEDAVYKIVDVATGSNPTNCLGTPGLP